MSDIDYSRPTSKLRLLLGFLIGRLNSSSDLTWNFQKRDELHRL